jgi:hypothetical protein
MILNSISPEIVFLLRTLTIFASITGMILFLINTRNLIRIGVGLLVIFFAVSVFSSLVLNAHGLAFKGVDGPPTIRSIFVFFLESGGVPFVFVVTSCSILFKIDAAIKARQNERDNDERADND